MSAKTILAVDDSATMREMIFQSLSEIGYRVVLAVDGVDALDKLRSEAAPSVIITDINMPRMNGIALIDRVRREGPNRTTPILVLSTETDANWKAQAKQAGATGWITKPFNPERIADAIRKVSM
jgi:two-component system chemotaxis response regulator CheY